MRTDIDEPSSAPATEPTGLKIGVALPQAGSDASPENVTAIAQLCEGAGFDSLWVFERLLRPTRLYPIGPNGEPMPLPAVFATVFDPIETLTWAAASTERISLGTSVLNGLFHPPVILARRLATLDQFSNGRVIAGIGQGSLPEEFDAANIPTAHRGAVFEEYIAALRACWAPDPVAFASSTYTIPESQIGPKPVQPTIPVIIGAHDPRAIHRAGRIADGFNYGPPPGAASWDGLAEAIATFRNGAASAKRSDQPLEVIVRANVIALDPGTTVRAPFQGEPSQLRADADRAHELGATHVFFDFGMAGTPIADQQRAIEALAP